MLITKTFFKYTTFLIFGHFWWYLEWCITENFLNFINALFRPVVLSYEKEIVCGVVWAFITDPAHGFTCMSLHLGFLLELKKQGANDKQPDTRKLLSLAHKIHLVLVKTDKNGETHLLGSHYLEWRGNGFIKCDAFGCPRWMLSEFAAWSRGSILKVETPLSMKKCQEWCSKESVISRERQMQSKIRFGIQNLL